MLAFLTPLLFWVFWLAAATAMSELERPHSSETERWISRGIVFLTGVSGTITTITVVLIQQRFAARQASLERQVKAEEVKAKAEEVRVALELRAKELDSENYRRYMEAQRDIEHLKRALAENTKISSDAFKEANTVNQKIEQVGKATQDILEQQRDKNTESADLAQLSDTKTGTVVADIQKKVGLVLKEIKKGK